MKNLPSDKFEELIKASLKTGSLSGLSSDADFLRRLNQCLYRPQPETGLFQMIFSGISNGLVAAAIGVVLLVGLNTLPPIFVNATVTGTGMVQEKIVQITLKQRILWQQMALNLERLK